MKKSFIFSLGISLSLFGGSCRSVLLAADDQRGEAPAGQLLTLKRLAGHKKRRRTQPPMRHPQGNARVQQKKISTLNFGEVFMQKGVLQSLGELHVENKSHQERITRLTKHNKALEQEISKLKAQLAMASRQSSEALKQQIEKLLLLNHRLQAKNDTLADNALYIMHTKKQLFLEHVQLKQQYTQLKDKHQDLATAHAASSEKEKQHLQTIQQLRKQLRLTKT